MHSDKQRFSRRCHHQVDSVVFMRRLFVVLIAFGVFLTACSSSSSNLSSAHDGVSATVAMCRVSSTTSDGMRQRADVTIINKTASQITPSVVVRWKDGTMGTQRRDFTVDAKAGGADPTSGTDSWTIPSDAPATLAAGDQNCSAIIESVSFTLNP
jgi:hypothetical protein